MLFREIPGMEEVKSSLSRTVETGQVAHALLFKGRPGSGGLALALAYATLLTCENPSADACGTCPSCTKNSKFVHPDIHFSFPVSPIKGISGKDVVSDSFITSWREFLASNPYGGPGEWSTVYGGENKQLNISREESRCIVRALSLKSFEGGYKVMIMWLPEYLHPASANALLKILEEPPENTLFLLVTHDHEQLLSTILSRTQVVTIRDFRPDEMAAYVEKQTGIGSEKALQIAQAVSGNVNEALRMAGTPEGDDGDLFKRWMRSCWNARYGDIVQLAEEYNTFKKINQKAFFSYALSMLHASLRVVNGADNVARMAGNDAQFIRKFAGTMDTALIAALNKHINRAAYHIERNANPRIVFTDLSLTIASIFRRKKAVVG